MIIFRYLAKEITASLLATTLVLLVILMMNQFVHYLNAAAGGAITMTAVMQVMCLQVPLLLGFLLPMGLFFGILLALGRLYADHEMTVLSACGVSRLKLLGMVLMLAIAAAVVVAWLMLWAEPKVQWYRTRIISQALATATVSKILPGRFQQMGKDNRWTFYAAGLGRHHKEMHDVFLARQSGKDNNGQWDIVTANSAHETHDAVSDDDFLIFRNGYRTIGTPGLLNYQIIRFDQYGIRLGVPSLKDDHDVKFLSTTTLWNSPSTDKDAKAELAWRLALPISVLLFTLIAVPLSYTRPRHGRYAQLLPAIVIYIVYADFMFVGRSWIETGAVSTGLGLWWLHGAMLLLGGLLSYRFVKRIA